MMSFEKIVKTLTEHAKEKGASSVKLISTTEVFVEDYVRQKCQYGCKMYARKFTCPPYSPSPDQTRKTLKGYDQALLIEFAGMKEEGEQLKVHEAS
jgi:predicted metal-binding protein